MTRWVSILVPIAFLAGLLQSAVLDESAPAFEDPGAITIETQGSTASICVDPTSEIKYGIGTFSYDDDDRGYADPMSALSAYVRDQTPSSTAESFELVAESDRETPLYDELTSTGTVKRRVEVAQFEDGDWRVVQVWEGTC